MLKRHCLVCCLLSFLCIYSTAHADEFKQQLSADSTETEVTQQAARAFVRSIQSTIVTDKKTLQKYIDSTVLLNGKEVTKEAITAQLDAVLNEKVASCVAQSNVEEDVPMRGGVEFMVGYGCLWFSFNNDDIEQPRIFAINNK